jgi:hypothetical protein
LIGYDCRFDLESGWSWRYVAKMDGRRGKSLITVEAYDLVAVSSPSICISLE